MVMVLLVVREKVSRLNILTFRFGRMTSFIDWGLFWGCLGGHRLAGDRCRGGSVVEVDWFVCGWRSDDLILDRNESLGRRGESDEGLAAHVDVEARREWAAIVDSNDDRLVVAKVGDLDVRSEGERLVGGGEGVHVVLLARCRSVSVEGVAVEGSSSEEVSWLARTDRSVDEVSEGASCHLCARIDEHLSAVAEECLDVGELDVWSKPLSALHVFEGALFVGRECEFRIAKGLGHDRHLDGLGEGDGLSWTELLRGAVDDLVRDEVGDRLIGPVSIREVREGERCGSWSGRRLGGGHRGLVEVDQGLFDKHRGLGTVDLLIWTEGVVTVALHDAVFVEVGELYEVRRADIDVLEGLNVLGLTYS